MKKIGMGLSLVVVAIVAFCLATAPKAAEAGSVYDRTVITTSTAAVATWTNKVPYAAVLLKNIWISQATMVGDTVTVTRVSSGTDTAGAAYVSTQAVGSVVCTAGAGNTTSFTAAYLKYGDLFVATGLGTSNYCTMVEYEVQQH